MDTSQWQPLRVLIAGQQGNFDRVLAANIARWGHEVTIVPLTGLSQNCETDDLEGDVLLYDLDASSRSAALMKRRDPSIIQEGFLEQDSGRICAQWFRTKLTIALSSRSVSRCTLEQLEAVALLQKPFEMSLLRRYLSILQRLLHNADAPGDEAPPPLLSQRIRVLVVDDDVDVAHSIRQCLSAEYFEDEDEAIKFDVAVAYDGLEALEQCITWHPHCVVTDLIMPRMNGYQVMRCLSAGANRFVPTFVVISALTQFEVPVNRSYLEGKVIVYITKPFDLDHLLSAIKQVCASVA